MLQKFSAGFVCLAWSLWFGGLAAIFLFAAALFAKDRETALKAAPIMFLIFEKYQILIAAAALVGSLSWRILAKSARVTLLFYLIAIATLPAALGPIFVTQKMEELRKNDQTESPEFKKLHGISMSLYSGELLVLLLAGLAMPWAMRDEIRANISCYPSSGNVL